MHLRSPPADRSTSLATLSLALLFAALLAGCAQDEQPPAAPQQQVDYGPAVNACVQRARALGFNVLGQAPVAQMPDGTVHVPVLVEWSIQGGVNLDCRYSPAGGASIS